MKSRFKPLLPVCAALFFQFSALGATITWTNALGGSWNVAGNWNPNQVPGPSDQAILSLSGAYSVAITSDQTVGGLSLSGGSLILNGALTSSNAVVAGGTLAGGASGTLKGVWTWSGGTIGSTGALTLASQARLTITLAAGESLSLAGTLTNEGTILIQGGGTLLLNGAAAAGQLINQAGGAVQAQGNAAIAEGGSVGGALLNAGILEVQNGALTLNTPHGTGGGQFVADAGAVLAFTNGYSFGPGASLTGGGTNLLTGGIAVLNGAVSSSNAVLAGAVVSGTNATLLGSWTWSGGSLAAGSGLTVGGNSSLRAQLTGNDALVAAGMLTNAGTILVQGNGSLQLDTSAGGGLLVNQNSGELSVQGAVVIGQTGPTNALVVNLGEFVNAGGSNTTTVAVNFTNAGVVYAESGALNFTGDYSGANGRLEFGIGGAQNSGSVSFSGTAVLGGALGLSLTSGFTPAAGAQFPIISYGSASGSFAATNLSAALSWQTAVGSTQTVVDIVTATPPPSITLQPAGSTVGAGGSVTFNAAATGPGPLGYQWQFDGLALAGATNSSLTLNNVGLVQAGVYSLVASDAAGSTTTSNALLTVASGGSAGFGFNISGLVQGVANLVLPTQLGTTYVVEYKEDLTDAVWTPLQIVVGTGLSVAVTDQAATAPIRFYRARAQ